MPGFEPLPAQVDLPALEQQVLTRWQDAGIFERSLKQTAGGPRWTFYEGPPTANGMPGAHHVEARTFKDLFPRFKTMQGFHVPRKAGWDCHGLPVEVAVEKELGLTGKRDIEAYGVAAFNARCRESVLRHVDAWLEMSRRMGYWADTDNAYRTMDASYVESVWWSLKNIYEQGLLVRDHRISPYCPRCGTPLSDHEMGQEDVYQTVSDPAVTVRFRLRTLPVKGDGEVGGAPGELEGADLLVWTTTPWTLVANTAAAVHPEATYVVARRSRDGDRVVVADDLFARVLGDGWHVAARFSGQALVGARYQPPFGLIKIPDAHVVIPGSFVTTEDGTGLVHLAPAFGADDMEASRAYGLPVVNPIRPDGHFEDDVPLVGGMFFKDADRRLIADLDDRGLLFRSERHVHSYPHCWRCGTLLLYYAVPSWFIKTTAIKDKLLAENERTNWYPATVKGGRYGEWLRNNVDWALSRTRYWGTPLPLWVCSESHLTCVGSLAELSELAGRDLTRLDPHRPFVDAVTFPCPSCEGEARRVPEVIDVWYDSGAMPFAQYGAPLRGAGEFAAAYPAQFICEALDQTRGWFYSLMAVGTMVFGRSAYENVVCVGLLVDETGRKMSKHLGNVLEPIPLMDAHGADALRWFFAASGSPWGARRVGHDVLSEIVRKVLLTFWNTASFLVLYANAGGWSPSEGAAPPVADRPLLDRWLLSELHTVVRDVTLSLESFDTAAAGRRLATLIDDLSNWYVRRSRRRFWDGPSSVGGTSAFATLYECVTTLTLLMAPFAPFVTDYVWGVLRREGTPESVHLASWPAYDSALINPELSAQMALARRLVELGRSARSGASVRTRQPLSRALIGAAGFEGLPGELRSLIAEELNVASLAILGGEAGELVDYAVKPNFRALGRRFGAQTPAVAAAIAAAPAADIATAVLAGGTVLVGPVSGSSVSAGAVSVGAVSVGADDVIVTQTPRAGWAVATDAGETVAIDTAVTAELRREGLAREVIRRVQEARKNDGLDITDRIALRWAARDPELAAALTEHAALIAGEVLAVEFGPAEADPGPGDAREHVEDDIGLRFWLRRARLLGLVREAGPAGGAASLPGGGEGHHVQVAIAHEADEDAAGLVVSGNARNDGYFQVGVRVSGLGLLGFLGLLGLLGPGGRSRLRLAGGGFGFCAILTVGGRLVLGRPVLVRRLVFGRGLVARRRGVQRLVALRGLRGCGRLGGLPGRGGFCEGFCGRFCGGGRGGLSRDRIVAPLPGAAGRSLGARGERGRAGLGGIAWCGGGTTLPGDGGQVTGTGRTGRDGGGPARPGRRYSGGRRSGLGAGIVPEPGLGLRDGHLGSGDGPLRAGLNRVRLGFAGQLTPVDSHAYAQR